MPLLAKPILTAGLKPLLPLLYDLTDPPALGRSVSSLNSLE